MHHAKPHQLHTVTCIYPAVSEANYLRHLYFILLLSRLKEAYSRLRQKPVLLLLLLLLKIARRKNNNNETNIYRYTSPLKEVRLRCPECQIPEPITQYCYLIVALISHPYNLLRYRG